MELTRGLLTGILLAAPIVTIWALQAIYGHVLEGLAPRQALKLGTALTGLLFLLSLKLLIFLSLL